MLSATWAGLADSPAAAGDYAPWICQVLMHSPCRSTVIEASFGSHSVIAPAEMSTPMGRRPGGPSPDHQGGDWSAYQATRTQTQKRLWSSMR